MQMPSSFSLKSWVALSEKARDFLLPPLCLGCRQVVEGAPGLCSSCWQAMPWIDEPVCERLGTPLHTGGGKGRVSAAALQDPPPWHRARAASRYDGLARKLVQDFKFRDHIDLAHFLAQAMARAGRDLLEDEVRIVGVPIHRNRLWQRRFNQSTLLAAELARITDLKFLDGALERAVRTRPQVGLSRDQRRRNVAGAFAVRESENFKVSDQAILLIDDVLTSGATAAAATRALQRAGAKSVDVLCFSRVAPEDALLA